MANTRRLQTTIDAGIHQDLTTICSKHDITMKDLLEFLYKRWKVTTSTQQQHGQVKSYQNRCKNRTLAGGENGTC